MTTAFDPNAYLNLTTDSPFETRFTPIPENEYPATIDDVKMRVIEMKDKSQRLIASLSWSVLDDALKTSLNMSKILVRQDVFVDLTPTGAFDTDKNKNIDLGRVREAVGQQDVRPWSIAMLRGAGPAKIKVTQRPDEKDETKIYNDVKAVTRLAA